MKESGLTESLGGVSLRIVSLFAGIGGLEVGLSMAGHRALVAAETWEPARAVLMDRLRGLPLFGDVATIEALPDHDLLTAGFPCTDLSPAGSTRGIDGPQSGLVRHVFRLARRYAPEWILLENVPNLLVLHRGAGMRKIISHLEALGYRWAYRVVDSRFTGVPQRRLRVVILAARTHWPEVGLLRQDAGIPPAGVLRDDAYGFYWTEGRGGLGWAHDAIPTLKGGSTIGINSAPAVWLPKERPGRRLVLPSIEDGERLQGFPPGWTAAAAEIGGRDHRWKLIGNAVTVGVAQWLGYVLTTCDDGAEAQTHDDVVAQPSGRWPTAAFGFAGRMWLSNASPWPIREPYRHLASFIDVASARPLSHRATVGFLKRVKESSLRIDPRFVSDVELHVRYSQPPSTRMKSSHAFMEETLPTTSWASSLAARHRMQANRGRDTKPELEFRRALHALGIRYRVQVRPTPAIRNRLDVVLRPARLAVDVRGCFWHACPDHGTMPKENAGIWAEKLRRNVERDQKLERRLESIGWRLEVVWEHEDPLRAADRVREVVLARRQAR